MNYICMSSLAPVIGEVFPAYPNAGENIAFILVGFLFVLAVLALLALVTGAIGKGMARVAKEPPAVAPIPAARMAQPAQAEAGPFEGHPDPEHIPAVIAAAVHTMLQGRRHRIKGVRVASGRWAQEGRRDIFSSHRIR